MLKYSWSSSLLPFLSLSPSHLLTPSLLLFLYFSLAYSFPFSLPLLLTLFLPLSLYLLLSHSFIHLSLSLPFICLLLPPFISLSLLLTCLVTSYMHFQSLVDAYPFLLIVCVCCSFSLVFACFLSFFISCIF